MRAYGAHWPFGEPFADTARLCRALNPLLQEAPILDGAPPTGGTDQELVS